ncbi:unnamed protein product [Parascedosporium putredinis]|uniref:Uncharacterized protein n=1 Tax=Parascedosporium putredinis TaxID=1442378 RepID=A0A9P1HAJ8_9PEZI|nr:unnamed protein product [Parascedosporium putredinis]CAI8004671.1 unnamed protein product [Parascedosporium putredinis]
MSIKLSGGLTFPHNNIITSSRTSLAKAMTDQVSIDLTLPKSLQGRTAAPFALKSDNGTAYITNQRVKLTFKDGGHNEFRSRFEELKERLHHVREIQRETGQSVRIPDEPLPAYEAPLNASSSAHLAPQPAPTRSDSAASRGRAPDEPPPGYEEAQAQTISMRLEDHIRDAADRGNDG